ncbi:MAG: RHS repeat domain-containing protein [Pseudomarimonas sp.]
MFDVAANDGFDIDLGLDVAGNVTSLTERQGSNSVLRSVEYDGQNRLTEIRDGANLIEGFGYDATGNRTARSTATATTPYTTVPSSHRLQSVGPITRGYDAAGNTSVINDPAPKTLIYNDLGRLREFKVSGALKAGYRYNGRGERVVKLHPTDVNQNRYFVYTDSGQLLGEYNKDGSRVAEYVWMDDTLVAIYSDHDASTYQFVQTDHLGTPRAVVHPSRNRIVWRWDLAGSAFGDHAPVTDPDADGKVFGLNLRYPGQYFDAESGLHYNYFRDYEPGTGRYIESDPIGLDGGHSTFGYAAQSPMLKIDPTGESPYGICGIIALADGPEPFIADGVAVLCVCGVAISGFFATKAVVDAAQTTPSSPDATCDENSMCMAKGGEQNKANEYSRAAAMEPDPCSWLRAKYDSARASRDTVAQQKIKLAQKFLGCRHRG